MKRSYQQYCDQNSHLVQSKTFSLVRDCVADVLGLVVQYLDLDSLRNLMFCLLLEHDIGIGHVLSIVNLDEYSQTQRTHMKVLQSLLTKCSPAAHLDCMVRHIEAIGKKSNAASVSWIRRSGEKAQKNAKSTQDQLRWMAQNECYPLMVFLNTASCDRCRVKLRDVCYWDRTRPVNLCTECQEQMAVDPKTDPLKPSDGYAWLTASRLKALCWVPNQIKASDFAQRHAIRLYSRKIFDDPKATVPDKEYYFMLDAMAHFRSL
jgi:hypothetical protein